MRHRALVVDDDSSILEVLEIRLVSLGFDVTTARTSAEALAAVEQHRYDLALIDLWMHPLDGITLMEHVHRAQPRLPILIMSGQATIETAVSAVQRGAFDFLTKPFVKGELQAKVARALSQRRWARDRERLRTVGETLASSGVLERVLDAVAQAAVETTEAEHSVVFLLEKGRLTPMARAGSPAAASETMQAAAVAAMNKGVPTMMPPAAGHVTLAAPLFLEGGPAGALVTEGPERIEPTEDDLEVLALFSAQAAVAIRNTNELARLRSGALAALGRIATEVAHELKNPLGGLKLYARHLEQRLQRRGDTDGREIATKIADAIDHLTELVTEITAFGRTPELRRVPTDINALLDDCLALVQDRLAEGEIRVVKQYDASCPKAALDGRELRKVFLNLIVNGLDAIEGPGTLRVGTSCGEDGIEIVVEDSGTGMTQETVSRMFDLFFTTKPTGTGLGTAIARSVVSQHGGTIHVDSVPGAGTRVSVRLPSPAGS